MNHVHVNGLNGMFYHTAAQNFLNVSLKSVACVLVRRYAYLMGFSFIYKEFLLCKEYAFGFKKQNFLNVKKCPLFESILLNKSI